MSATYNVGDQFEVQINGMPYLAQVITYDETQDPVMYQLSVIGLGDVVFMPETDIPDDNG